MKIVGVGATVPETFTTNSEIESQLGLESGWIARRTGIERRPTAEPNEATSDLAILAAKAALKNAAAESDAKHEVGLLLLATSTPDHLLPPTAPLVAHKLGL